MFWEEFAMGKINYIEGTGIPPRSFDQEFLTHKKCSEWWYCTGYLEDGKGSLFGFQFTLAKISLFGLRPHLLICSVTDFRDNKHYNTQTPILFHKGVSATSDLLSVDGKASMSFSPNNLSSKGKMQLEMSGPSFSLEASLDASKPPVWHCDNGVLQMGIQGDKEKTYYYSFTNIKAAASLALNGETFSDLHGKAWFDRQGGTYTITDPRTCWEWLSLRFFDNTEAMIFAFPQDNYYDGTFIAQDGARERLNNYKLEAIDVITYEGKKFSNGWKLEMKGKKYSIEPKASGMFNVFFFELLADIKDESGKAVGYCFVELLPGVRNKLNNLDAFKKKKG
jgi:predicted secreted hydrolase